MISELPLYLFTLISGLGAGAYALAAVFPSRICDNKRWFIPLVCLILVGVGMLTLPFHLGRPDRLLIALENPMSSIAQEGYCGILLAAVLCIDLIWTKAKGSSPRALQIVGLVIALLLLIAMGKAYMEYVINDAWSNPVTIALFLVGSLAAGGLLFAALSPNEKEEGAHFSITLLVLQILLAVSLLAETAVFSAAGDNFIFMAFGAALALIETIAFALVFKKGAINKNLLVALAVVAILSVALARYGFYLAA